MELGVKDQKLPVKTKAKKNLFEQMKKQKTLIIMSIPFIIWVAIFCYAPLIGWVMAFQKFKPAKGLFDQVWCGLDQFKILFSDSNFFNVLRNTLCMAIINLNLKLCLLYWFCIITK